MRISAFFLPLSLLIAATYSNAASVALTEEDCLEIMQRYASDPESVPQHLLDECKEMLGNLKPSAGQQKATADPCADPANADSVQCWGPWASLAPAGGFQPDRLAAIDEFDTRPELAEEFQTEFEQTPLPFGSCAAGTACGFATLAPGLEAQPDNTSSSQLVPFAFAANGSNFIVNPAGFIEGAAEIASLDNLQSGDFAGIARFQTTNEATGSLLIAGVEGVGEELRSATGLWRHGSLMDQNAGNTNSGVFAWGLASSQNTLDMLNNGGQNTSIIFSGNMASDTRTAAEIVVNFGTDPNWSGTWDNTARDFNFGAGGSVNGADLISAPNQFTANVQQVDSYVQGILLGERGDQSVAHAINITLTEGLDIVRDVGTLRQVVVQP